MNASEAFSAGYFYVYVYVTGDKTTPESTEFGDYDESGWVDPNWNHREFFENRNDVKPFLVLSRQEFNEVGVYGSWLNEYDESPEELIRETLKDVLGNYDDNGDGTYYASNAQSDFQTGADYSYAAHVSASDHAMRYPNIRQTDIAI